MEILPFQNSILRSWQVIPVNGPPLRSEVKAVALYLHKQDFIPSLCKRLVHEQDAGLYAGVGIENTRRQADNTPEVIFYEHLSQCLVGVLTLKDDPFRYDDTCPASDVQMFCNVVNEEHFAPLSFNAEPVVRPDAALWRHEGRICEDYVIA